MNADKLMETIKGITPPKQYTIKEDEADAIYESSNGGAFHCIGSAFRYGFLQGQRAERDESKKKALEKRRREEKKEAPGYCYLTVLIERNKSNQRFVNIITAFIHAFETI